MSKTLEELFDLAPSIAAADPTTTVEETKLALAELDATLDKIDAALPIVLDLDTADTELDELAVKASGAFDDLMELGYSVEPRFSAEIFGAAGNMLGHALAAKTAKLNKKLKMVDLQLKKVRRDRELTPTETQPETGSGHSLRRNELLDRLIGDRSADK